MSTGLQTRPAEGKLRDWIAEPTVHSQLVAAVGDIMDPEQFLAQAIVAFQDPKVKNCTPLSQFTAIHQLAALGLLPTLGQVALIPYKDIIKCMPQAAGLKALMERHPAILEVEAFIVHKSDSILIHNGEVDHNYDPFDETRIIKSTADIKGGYVKIVYRDGRPPKYHFVTAAHIEKCRKCAQTQEVWNKWPEQMILKTLYRDCYARRAVPMDPLVHARLQQVVDLDDANLGNNPARVESKVQKIVDGTKESPPDNDVIDAEPEREPGIDDEPPPDVNQSESADVSQFIDDLAGLDAKQVKDALKIIPAAWSPENRQRVTAAIEMRLADLTAQKGQKSFA